MPRSDAGYVEPSGSSDLIDLYVQYLNGEGQMLKLSGSCTGLEVYRMVSAELPPKKGENSSCIILTRPWHYTKHCRSKVC